MFEKSKKMQIGVGAFAVIAIAGGVIFFHTTQVSEGKTEASRPQVLGTKISYAYVPGIDFYDTTVVHIPTPKEVKGVYLSGYGVTSPVIRERILKLVTTTELNSVVLDVKDNTGVVTWQGRNPNVGAYIAELHSKGVYVIGRITAFQDPIYAEHHPEEDIQDSETGLPWRDYKNAPWVDPASKKMWKYLSDLGIEAYKRGYDEIQYDYIRYPTDGNLLTMRFPTALVDGVYKNPSKKNTMTEFYAYLKKELGALKIPISGDSFGIIFNRPQEEYTIGTNTEGLCNHFDYISPMVYPSHFYPGTANYDNPAAYPGEIITYIFKYIGYRLTKVLGDGAANCMLKMRPWYQSFDRGAVYDGAKVRAQIEAGYALGVKSWLIWNAANIYSTDSFLPKA